MQTRRQLLKESLVLPVAAGLGALEIVSEPNCLSNESADGFRCLSASAASKIIVLCGVSAVAASFAVRLRARAAAGSWVIWESSPFPRESQARILREVFDIATGEPAAPADDDLYIRYRWPCAALTRSFSAAIPVACSRQEAIAQYRNKTVAMKRAIGRGGIVFLGSMLGPNLRAEEREARVIGRGLFNGRA